MNFQEILLLALIILLLAVLILLVLDRVQKKRQPEDTESYRHIKSEYDKLLEQKNSLSGKYSELERQNSEYKIHISELNRINQKLDTENTVYVKNKENNDKETNKKISDLDNARKALEEEKNRVTETDRKKMEKEEEERTRIWAMHEDNSKSVMREICQKSSVSLPYYDNNNLPDGFDTKLKPDFMVRLLDQFVIFDPKSSSSQNINNYISTQVKSTAVKIKKSDSNQDIYRTVFFIIPGIAMSEIKETYYIEESISFFIIPLEAFEPIVMTLKRLEEYDLADKYDPQDRENIVNIIAAFDNHIRYQNATNILTAVRGLKVLEESENMPEEMIKEVENKREKIRNKRMSENEMKKLMDNPEIQLKEIVKLIAPKKSEISTKDLSDSEKLNV